MLTDMNERQLANLDPEDVAAFNRVFREHRDTLGWFGYELMDPGGVSRAGRPRPTAPSLHRAQIFPQSDSATGRAPGDQPDRRAEPPAEVAGYGMSPSVRISYLSSFLSGSRT